MTLPLATAPRSIASRIAAASIAHPILRRAHAVALNAEMALLPDSIGLAADWRALSSLLLQCELDLYPKPHMVPPVAGDIRRAIEFTELGRDAHNRGVLMRVRCERDAIRKGRRVPRIIDVQCVEVA